MTQHDALHIYLLGWVLDSDKWLKKFTFFDMWYVVGSKNVCDWTCENHFKQMLFKGEITIILTWHCIEAFCPKIAVILNW